jgi:hypothetical protein
MTNTGGIMKRIALSVALAFLFAGLLALNGCKSEDPLDITGTWNFTIPGGFSWTVTFTGSTGSGSVTDTYPECVGTGTYTVNDTQISFTMVYPCGPFNVQFTGTIASENSMSGTWYESYYDDSGTWTASR